MQGFRVKFNLFLGGCGQKAAGMVYYKVLLAYVAFKLGVLRPYTEDG